jgi:hypothetical protein
MIATLSLFILSAAAKCPFGFGASEAESHPRVSEHLGAIPDVLYPGEYFTCPDLLGAIETTASMTLEEYDAIA